MNIVMMTNTYKPIIGGLERSVETLAGELRRRGHRVLIIVPEIDRESGPDDPGVMRVPAITRVNHTEFPVQLPLPNELASRLKLFGPDIIHSHHPFLIGDTALRASARFGIPVIFTMHTLYEKYTHYLPFDSAALKRFMVYLSTGYANLCDHVLAPSRSIRDLLARRGVRTPMSVVPTGIRTVDFVSGRGDDLRRRIGIPPGAFVVGFVGRVAPEKNIAFLSRAVAMFMASCPLAYFLVVGSGPSEAEVKQAVERAGVGHRLRMAGAMGGGRLSDAYHAMDVFAFASQSETQGLVLAEAMAARVPVAAVDAPGVRDIVMDRMNGRLIAREDEKEFSDALSWSLKLRTRERAAIRAACRRTAERFSLRRTADRIEDIYWRLYSRGKRAVPRQDSFSRASHLLRAEWQIMLNTAKAASRAVLNNDIPVTD
ncbi:MAG: glycosyltransferase [Deltaproteobacteria bacterium]